jgi:hypothetical protein
MSATTDLIRAAREVVMDSKSSELWGLDVVPHDRLRALYDALKAYDARRAELKAMPINGGG